MQKKQVILPENRLVMVVESQSADNGNCMLLWV